MDESISDERTGDEREDILNACIGFAEQMLTDHGEFYPFGVSLRADGLTMDEVYGDDDEDGDAGAGGAGGAASDIDDAEVPEVPEVVERIVAVHREAAQRGDLLACGTTLDVLLTEPDGTERDAICVDVEHNAGEPVRCLLPYDLAEDGTLSYGELVAVRLDPEIFPYDK